MVRRLEIVKRAKRIKRRRQIVKLVLVTLLIVLIFGGFIVFANQQDWLIESIVAENIKIISADDISSLAQQTLAGNYLLFFPRRNIFWYPRQAIVDALLSRFLNLAKVEITIRYPNTLVILVSERRGEFVWCDTPDCYFMDATGLIFSAAPQFASQLFLVFSGPLPPEPIGQRPLSEEKFGRLVELTESFGRLLETVSGSGSLTFLAAAGEGGDFQLQFKPANGVEWSAYPVIIFNISQEAAAVVANLRSALATPDLQAVLTQKLSDLEYIDLRFPPKVFYKLRR